MIILYEMPACKQKTSCLAVYFPCCRIPEKTIAFENLFPSRRLKRLPQGHLKLYPKPGKHLL